MHKKVFIALDLIQCEFLTRKVCYFLFAFLLFVNDGLFAQGDRLIDEIKTHRDGIGLWWLGHNSWLIKSNDLLIATDLLLDYDKRINPGDVKNAAYFSK